VLGAALVLALGTVIWAFGRPSTSLNGTVDPQAAHFLVLPALWLAFILLAASRLLRPRLAAGRLGEAFAGPLALAVVTPLALVPAAAFGSPLTLALGAVAWPLSVWPLATAIAEEAAPPGIVRRTRLVCASAILGTLGLTPLLYALPGSGTWIVALREGLVALALLAPVVLIASNSVRTGGGWASSNADVAGTVGIAAAAVAPLAIRLVTTLSIDGSAVVFITLWVAAGAFIVLFGITPLVRLATRALRQRDLVASAADVERRRIAGDLHDGPLQSLTLLAYRLDAAGDGENAAFARDVVTELRAITSALRLPVVDDLGAGPALEWLTERVGRLAGTAIELDRADNGRPPIEVEHAIFRVAQEALANAARHGRPPIRVRYEADASRARLTVDDAGAGAGVVEAAHEDERGLGLVGMRERAHAIGAGLEIGSFGDGTRVSLVWPAAAP
jgi:signal transduction histidine kinase